MAQLGKNTVHTLRIQGYTAEGMGVGRLEGQVVFVPGVVDGELWEVLLVKVTKNVLWGKGVKLLEPSPERVTPDCPHAGKCGGCQYRHMTYQEELRAKRVRVQDALTRLGGVDLPVPPVLGAEEPLRYRNKVQFPAAEGKIGFYRARSHQVIDVEDCLLQPAQVSGIRRTVLEWMQKFNISCYDETSGRGLLRHLYVRTNHREQVLCCLVVNGTSLPHSRELVEELRAAVPGLTGVVLNQNRRDTNVILGPDYRTLWGEAELEEELCGLTFRLSVPSFFQVNRAQTEVLYRTALEFAGLTGEETVLDLYCGVGSITLLLAGKARRAIGGEIVPQAVENAKKNALANGAANAEFFQGDAGEIAARLARARLRPQTVVVDPPRKGLVEEVPGIVAGMGPERVVYVSCDPATLARDVKRFGTLGYRAVRVQPVDLFPRTAHVETVCLLSKLKADGTLRQT